MGSGRNEASECSLHFIPCSPVYIDSRASEASKIVTSPSPLALEELEMGADARPLYICLLISALLWSTSLHSWY